MQKTQHTIYKNLENVYSSPNAINTLIEIDRLLDRMDVYAYENWFSGEIVDGPFVERHWVELTLMYPLKMMPNPDAAMRLIKNGCKVKFGKQKIEVLGKVKDTNDIVTTTDGARIPRPATKEVWLVNMRIPMNLIDIKEDLKNAGDIDIESVEAAYDEELDGQKGLVDQETETNV